MDHMVQLVIGVVVILTIAIITVAIIPVTSQERSDFSEKETIKIGVLLPLTGIRAEAGKYGMDGLELALAEINSPEKKYKVELIYEDTEYKPEKAVLAFLKLKDIDKANFVIGPYGSSETLAIAPIAEENKIILISPSSQATAISDAGDYIFRTQIDTSQEGPFWARFVANISEGKPVHFLVINTDYGISYVDSFVPILEEHGGVAGLIEKFNAEETDYRTQLLKFKTENAEYIQLATSGKQAGNIARQATELGMNITFFGTSPIEGEELITTGGEFVEGILYPYPYDDASIEPQMKTYSQKYLELYGKINEMVSANAYDALSVLSTCFERVGTDVDKVKDCLYSLKDYPGASGTFSFDENGDVVKQFIVKTVRNGTFVKI